MPNYTKNLKLFKYDPTEDSELAFSIKNALNDNWDRIDEFLQNSLGGHKLFDIVMSDHLLTYEETKGWALQGTYVYKEAVAGSRFGYPDFYEKCLEEYNETTNTVTINDKTVRVHSNGHMFYNIEDKEAIDTFYNTYGSAWFYGIDKDNERIFLPRKRILKVTSDQTIKVFGTDYGLLYHAPQNDNIYNIHWETTDNHRNDHPNIRSVADGGALKSQNITGEASLANVGGNGAIIGLISEAVAQSKGISDAGLEGTVRYDEDTNAYLYICVGNTVSDTSWIDIVTQVNNGVKEIDDAVKLGTNTIIAEANSLAKCLYNVFSINSGDVDETGSPTFLQVDEGYTTLSTSGTFIATTASGVSYQISDVITCNISTLNGTYNIWLDPKAKEISLDTATFTVGKAFPSDASEGDYLLNISRVPYELQVYSAEGITTSDKILCGTITIERNI